MILYEVFFYKKYCNCKNSFTIVEEARPDLMRFINYWINNMVDKNLSIIDKVIEKYIKYVVYNKDKKEDKEKISNKENIEKNDSKDRKIDKERIKDE